MMDSRFSFVDLFAGLGGFHLAAAKLGGECVFASELQADLRELYKVNHGVCAAGDINFVSIGDIPDHDLLCAGFPCQPFSKAGAQLGWRDAVRGTLFFKIAEILELRRPEFVVLENVANFVRHDDGNTFAAVVSVLSDLGYDSIAGNFSPHNFGIPQIRERMYLVARLRSLGGLVGFEWPRKETKSGVTVHSILDRNPAGARQISSKHRYIIDAWQEFLDIIPGDAKLPHFPIWSCEAGATYPVDEGALKDLPLKELISYKGSYGRRITGRRRVDAFECLPPYATRGDFPKWKQEFILQNRAFFKEHSKALKSWLKSVSIFEHSFQKFEWNCQGEVRDLDKHILQLRASGIRVKRATSAPALVAMTTSQVPIIPWENRYMTARECARLQSMEGLSELPGTTNSTFKALGNAVNVEVARRVISSLLSLKHESINVEVDSFVRNSTDVCVQEVA